MAGRFLVENSLKVVDVLRHVADAAARLPSEVDWALPESPDAQQARPNARGAAWREARQRDNGANPLDISWAINQASGALRSTLARFPSFDELVDARAPVTSGWYDDLPLDDDLARQAQQPDLPSLNRRPGVIFLPRCDYYIDQPIYLYPGQVLRGAGVEFDRRGGGEWWRGDSASGAGRADRRAALGVGPSLPFALRSRR